MEVNECTVTRTWRHQVQTYTPCCLIRALLWKEGRHMQCTSTACNLSLSVVIISRRKNGCERYAKIVPTSFCSMWTAQHPPSQPVWIMSPIQWSWQGPGLGSTRLPASLSCCCEGEGEAMCAAWAAVVKMASSMGRRSQIAVAGTVISFCCITRHEWYWSGCSQAKKKEGQFFMRKLKCWCRTNPHSLLLFNEEAVSGGFWQNLVCKHNNCNDII